MHHLFKPYSDVEAREISGGISIASFSWLCLAFGAVLLNDSPGDISRGTGGCAFAGRSAGMRGFWTFYVPVQVAATRQQLSEVLACSQSRLRCCR